MNTCQTCSFWTREPQFFPNTVQDFGKCACPKFVYGSDYDADFNPPIIPDDGLEYNDAEGYSAHFKTGQNFGCVHHQPLS